EYDSDVIRKHERTRKDKEDDRTRHMLTLGAQTGPVFLTYRGRPDIDQIVTKDKEAEPLYDFDAPGGVQHTIWRLTGSTAGDLTRMFDAVPLLYIADGHHRAASASRAALQLRGQGPVVVTSEFEYFLAVAFPADQLRILAYNRVVKGLNGMGQDRFLELLRERFSVSPGADAMPATKGDIRMYLGGRWYSLTTLGTPVQSQARDPILSMDVSMLER